MTFPLPLLISNPPPLKPILLVSYAAIFRPVKSQNPNVKDIKFNYLRTSRLGSKQYLGRDADEDREKNCDKRVEAKCHFCRDNLT